MAALLWPPVADDGDAVTPGHASSVRLEVARSIARSWVNPVRALIIMAQPNNGRLDDGILVLTEHPDDPCGETSCSLTVTDSLGSSATVTLPPPTY